jgi:hypothetical protein
MLDDPEELSFCAMSPEPMVLEIAGQGIQLDTCWSFSVSIYSMTGEAGALAVVQRFALLNHFRGIR